MGTAKAQPLRCFSRTHGDDGTQLTGLHTTTTAPREQVSPEASGDRAQPPWACGPEGRSPFPWVHGSGCRLSSRRGLVLFSRDDTTSGVRGNSSPGNGTSPAVELLGHRGIYLGVLDVFTQDAPAAGHAGNETGHPKAELRRGGVSLKHKGPALMSRPFVSFGKKEIYGFSHS
jgi:hypothetical protein